MSQQLPRQWYSTLPQEVARWEQEGLVSREQAEAILARYPEPSSAPRVTTIFMVLGALLVGLGVILFFAANWQAMPTALKLTIIFGTVIASHAAGWHLWFGRGDYPRLGHALIFLGCLLYGAGIWLVAQIFHLDSHYPNGALLWAMGSFPVAFATRSRWIGLLSVALVGLWNIMEQAGFDSPNLWFAALFALSVLMAYHLRSTLALGLALLESALWLGLDFGRWAKEPHAAFAALVLWGLGLFAWYLWHERAGGDPAMAWPYKYAGGGLVFLGLLLLTFGGGRDQPLNALEGLTPTAYVLAAVLVANLLAAALMALRRRQDLLPDVLGLGLLAASTLALPLLSQALPRLLFYNLLLVAALLGSLFYGMNRLKSPGFVTLTLLFFVADIIARYFDFFFELLDRSIFFIVGGLLLLAGGTFIERSRRRLLEQLKEGSA